MFHASAAYSQDRQHQTRSIELCTHLRAAHAELIRCIDEMERVTLESTPDVARYTMARLRISRASLARRSLWLRAQQHLQGTLDPNRAAQLRELVARDIELGLLSAKHVATWTVAAIRDHWAEYRDASREIRHRMRQCIEAEKQMLYPMLS